MHFNSDPSIVATVTGVPKNLVAWRSITDSFDRIIVGTHSHLYLINNSVFYDITPLRKTSENLTNPLVTTNTSSVVTVTDTSFAEKANILFDLYGKFLKINSHTCV